MKDHPTYQLQTYWEEQTSRIALAAHTDGQARKEAKSKLASWNDHREDMYSIIRISPKQKKEREIDI